MFYTDNVQQSTTKPTYFLSNIKSLISRPNFNFSGPVNFKKPLLILIFLFLIIAVSGLILFGLIYFFEPTSLPKNVIASNISDQQVTLTWTTTQPAKGGVIVIPLKENFPILPVFSETFHKDDGEKLLKTMGKYTTHSVTITGLKPVTTYKYKIYQGNKGSFEGKIRTTKVLSDLSRPNPVYGRVIAADRKTPAVGAIVYLQAQVGTLRSSVLSALTNTQGRWSIDLSNLRTQDLSVPFKLTPQAVENVIIEAGSKGRFKVATPSGKDKPWPDIILSSSRK